MNKLLLVSLCLASCMFTAQAADTGTDTSITVLKEIQVFTVQKDGSFVRTTESYRQINEERAVRSAAQAAFHYNATLETVDIVEAYTEKPDGRRVAVTPDQIKLQQEPQYSGAPMFQDMLVKTLIYPEVAIGDKLYSRVTVKRSKALFDGQFSDVTYPLFMPTREMNLTYDMPQAMPLHADVDGFAAEPPVRHGERTVYRWRYVPSDNARIEADAVSYMEFGHHLLVSTFADYVTLGLAYDKPARAAAAPDARVTAFAQTLVKGISEPRARALAIDNWVRQNIRYVAVYIGNGGLVPHAAGAVLDNRYGDCKDHATLMEALLAAVGIDSTPVLINAGNAFRLSPVASLGDFNHAITYVPALDLYLDSTAEDISAGFLPVWDLDKPVILTRTGAMGRTPTRQFGQFKTHYTVTLAADGAASFEFTRANLGVMDEAVRSEHSNWRKTDQERFVEMLLKGMGIKGSGSVRLGDVSKAAKDYTFTLAGKAENWAYLPGTVGIATASSLYVGLSQEVFGMTGEDTRTQPYVCPVNDFVEDAHYAFPPGASVLVLPEDVRIASPFIAYQSTYRREEHGVLIHRSFKSGKPDTRVCSPDDFVAMQADIKRMVRDLRTQFILQSP